MLHPRAPTDGRSLRSRSSGTGFREPDTMDPPVHFRGLASLAIAFYTRGESGTFDLTFLQNRKTTEEVIVQFLSC